MLLRPYEAIIARSYHNRLMCFESQFHMMCLIASYVALRWRYDASKVGGQDFVVRIPVRFVSRWITLYEGPRRHLQITALR